jgi:integrase
MSELNSSPPAGPGKPARPAKPSPDFPLFPHQTGRWAKKIRGKMYYFGPWGDPEGALKSYEAQAEALHAGRQPRPDAADGCTVKQLANAFLNHKQALVDAGELASRTFDDYKEITDLLVARFGKGRRVDDLRPDDFASLRDRLARRWGPARLQMAVARVRTVLRYGYEAELLDRPVRTGPGFKPPSEKVLRLHKAAQGPKLFTAEQIRRMLDAAGVQRRAQILLGINCGLGNADCGKLPLAAVNLDAALLDFPRPKTGIPRRCVLWPETVAALREVLAARPQPRDPADAGLVFITSAGRPWLRAGNTHTFQAQFAKLLRRLGINGRKGLGFYTLRHVFRTVADEVRDPVAIDLIMGHSDPSMAGRYRERIDDARLRAVADHVRAWLFPPAKDGPEAKAASAATELAAASEQGA